MPQKHCSFGSNPKWDTSVANKYLVAEYVDAMIGTGSSGQRFETASVRIVRYSWRSSHVRRGSGRQ